MITKIVISIVEKNQFRVYLRCKGMSMLRIVICTIVFIGIFSCVKPPDYPIEPAIELIGISSDTMVQGNRNNDSILLVISFTDGDGDIGNEMDFDVVVRDLRDDFITDRFRLPVVPAPGSNNGISGEITLTIYTTCCVYANGQPPCTPSEQFPTDKVQYEIHILDRAGHQSNSIQTPPITLLCSAP
jgi:hypothetical protein